MKKTTQTQENIFATLEFDDITGNVTIYQDNGIVKEFEKTSDAVNYCKENRVMAYPEDESVFGHLKTIKALAKEREILKAEIN